MKKKRKNHPAPAAFRNNPFHSLKGASTRPNTPPQKDLTIEAEAAVDDADLFSRSVRGAKPIDRGEENAIEPADVPNDRTPRPEAPVDENESGLFLQAMTAIGAGSAREKVSDDDSLDESGIRRSPSSRMRQLRKGTIRIGQELDLHGSLRDDAVRKLHQFVAGAYARGDEAVLVITGKGINSPDGPVLPAAVRDWLAGPGKSMVAEFLPAPRDRGGSGAIVVFLRRRT